MKVLFISSVQDYIQPAKPVYTQEKIALGVSYISSMLRSAGHATRLVVLTEETQHEVLDAAVAEFGPSLVCLTAVFSEYPLIQRAAEYLKQTHPKLYLLVGGPHVSLHPDDAIRGPFDAVCIGEGEFPTLELVQQLEKGETPHGIKNLYLKHGSDIEKNPTRDFIQDLDCFPFPDREMWQPWIEDPDTFECVILGRGCAFNCTYCFNHALKGIACGNYVRHRSPENVLAEIRHLVEQRPETEHLYLEVETICSDMNFALELCRQLKAFNSERVRPVTFGANICVTPDGAYGALFAAMREAHFTYVNVGLESGSPRVREQSLQRQYSNEDIIRAVQGAKNEGLEARLFVLMGIPGETYEDFQQTLECTRQCQPDDVFLSIFTPYPGTVLYRMCEEMGLLNRGVDIRLQRRRALLNLPGFTRRQIQREYRLFPYRVYKGHRPLLGILRVILHEWIFTNFTLLALYRAYKRRPALRAIVHPFRR